ncbi:hypothetical protein APHAL10511_005301 [Amanita phalloides]|nr:hypothetical protein APHAL10511_005301 [Amanita phalloides]
MTLHGFIKGSEDGWTFYGVFSHEGGPPVYTIKGGLNVPIHHLQVPHAELFNAEVGSFTYEGKFGLEHINIRSAPPAKVIITGHLASPIHPTEAKGWLQIAEVRI